MTDFHNWYDCLVYLLAGPIVAFGLALLAMRG